MDTRMGPLALSSRESLAPELKVPREKNLEAAREFEGMLMSQFFQGLRKTVETSGLFGEENSSRQTYEYLLDQAVVAQAMQGGRGWGLAERLQKAWTEKGEK